MPQFHCHCPYFGPGEAPRCVLWAGLGGWRLDGGGSGARKSVHVVRPLPQYVIHPINSKSTYCRA